jgi:hypothetical protein
MPPLSNKRKPVRVLSRVKVAEISAVDVGAGEGCHVMLRKRDGKPDYEAFFGRIFGVKKKKDRHFGGYPPELCRQFAKNTDVPLDPDGPINPGGDDSDGTRIERGFGDDDDESARLDADADTDADRDDDDDFEKGDSTMDSQLISLAKKFGWRTVCENFVKRGSAADVFSETEVTQLLTAVARKAHPDLKPDVAFAKAFSAQTPDGELMRRTTQAARDAGFLSKVGGSTPHFLAGDGSGDGEGGAARERYSSASLRPRVTGGRAAQAVDNPRSALDDINRLVAQQRAQNPTLSEAQVFAQVYTDPRNAALVRREREENRPVAAW